MEEQNNPTVEINKTTKRDMYNIDPRNIVVVEGFNSRIDFDLDELKESIRENGVKNPISVIPFKDDNGEEKYRLVDGERRYRATMSLIEEGADIMRIPAMFLSKSLKPDELLVEQLIRNEGKHFSEYEYGIAFRKFVDLGYTPSEIVKKLGLAPWKVIFLTHTERDERVQALMREGKIEGTEVRRIYQAHGKDDEEGAVKEILKAAKKIEGTEKKKITLDDLDKLSSKTIAVKDSAAIKKGIKLLMEYYFKFATDSENLDEDGNPTFKFDMPDATDIYERLENKETIIDIFDSILAENEQEDAVYKQAE
jgi:ParB family transcriptional regulator, chromosome partitioning protein